MKTITMDISTFFYYTIPFFIIWIILFYFMNKKETYNDSILIKLNIALSFCWSAIICLISFPLINLMFKFKFKFVW